MLTAARSLPGLADESTEIKEELETDGKLDRCPYCARYFEQIVSDVVDSESEFWSDAADVVERFKGLNGWWFDSYLFERFNFSLYQQRILHLKIKGSMAKYPIYKLSLVEGRKCNNLIYNLNAFMLVRNLNLPHQSSLIFFIYELSMRLMKLNVLIETSDCLKIGDV